MTRALNLIIVEKTPCTMNVNITPSRTVTYQQLCSVCGRGFLLREDFSAHVRDPNRKLGGHGSRLNQPWQMDEPEKPEPIGPPHPFLTRVWCVNKKCGVQFHPSVIQTESKVTEDSAQTDYEQKLEVWMKRDQRHI